MMEGPDQPPKLNYMSREIKRPEVSKQQVLGGCLLSVVAIGIAVPLAIFATYDFVTRTRANALAWVFIGAVAAGIGVVAWATQRSYRWRGLAQGLWIGLGIAILLEGLCFLATRN